MLGLFTIEAAVGKSSLSFLPAFTLGIMCNFLVCIAVWIAYSSDTLVGKMLGLFMPVMVFVLAGYEHSVANMYYIPAGMAAAGVPELATLALEKGVDLSALSIGNMLMTNLLPVTLGNIIGGSVMVGGTYWFIYLRDK